MPASAQDILNQQFSRVLRGYDPSEVDRFLEELARHVGQSERQAAEWENRLAQATQRVAELERIQQEAAAAAAANLASLQRRVQELEAEVARYRTIEHSLTDAVLEARQAAATSVAEAQARAEEILRAADEEAAARVEAALREAAEELELHRLEITRLKEEKEALGRDLAGARQRWLAAQSLWQAFAHSAEAAGEDMARLLEHIQAERPAEPVSG